MSDSGAEGTGETGSEVAFVTGAASGIGAAVCASFLDAGVRVVGCDLEAQRGDLEILGVDVSDVPTLQEAIRRTSERLGRLDILVCAAGISRHQALLDVRESDWDELLAVNLKAAFFAAQAAAQPMLAAGHGRIVNVSSELAHLGSPTLPHYTAAKGGLLSLTRSLARALAPAVLVNVVVPGPVDTPMFHRSPQYREDFGEQMPIRRLPVAADIARTVAFLTGPGGSVYTGQQFNANGGLVMV
jgi:3-oxoacyl-[acyl-carrier protein] reductase